MGEEATEESVRVTLGQYLKSIREDRKMSLRQVEEATNKEVSNAYLSQLENDHIKQPSPHTLHTLSELYGIAYEGLMEMAGYITASSKRNSEDRHGRMATFAEHNLTQSEEAQLMEYLRFLRSKK